MDRRVYWASLSGEELAEALQNKLAIANASDVQRRSLWDQALRLFYGQDSMGGEATSHEVDFTGDQGEYLTLRSNHFRSLTQNLHTLITGSLMTLRAKAQSADSQVMERAEFADQLLEYYMAHKSIERSTSRAALYAILLGEGWCHLDWDVGQGDLYVADPSTGEQYREGEIRITPLRPDQVYRDPTRDNQTGKSHEWLMVEQQVNRYELLAKFPEFEDEILGLSDEDDVDDGAFSVSGSAFTGTNGDVSDDYVRVHHFYHERTPALPEGRYALLIGQELALSSDLQYDRIPVIGMVPDPAEHSSHGYAHAWDLMGPQALYDGIMSSTATSIESAGLPIWWFNEQDSVQPKDFEGGSIVSSMTEPQLKQFQYNPAPNLQFLGALREEMELLSGINSVVRGNPEKGLQDNAKAMMFVHAQAFQRLNDIHRGYTGLVSDVATCILGILRQYATTERVAELTGESGIATQRTWTGEDLEGVEKVTIEMTNPVHQSVAGRKAMADEFFEKGWVKGPHEYTRVLTTGRLDPVTRQYRNQDRLVAEENRRLRDGGEVVALATDDHLTHIMEHLAELDDVGVRLDQARSGAIMGHILEHVQLWKTTDKEILAAVNPQMLEASSMALQSTMEELSAQQQMAPPPMDMPPEAAGGPVGPEGVPVGPGVPVEVGVPLEGPSGGVDMAEAVNPDVPVDGPQQVLPPGLPTV